MHYESVKILFLNLNIQKTNFMYRLLAIISLFLISSYPAFSQFDYGLKAGITSSSLSADETFPAAVNQDFDKLKVEATNARLGFQGGAFARISLLGIFIQPELLFSSGGGEVTIQELDANDEIINEKIKKQTYNKLDLPVMAGISFGMARLQVGPVGSLMLSNNSALADYESYEEKFRQITWGYHAGIGIDFFETITLDLKYEGSLSKLGSGVEIDGTNYTFDNRSSQLVLNLGIMF